MLFSIAKSNPLTFVLIIVAIVAIIAIAHYYNKENRILRELKKSRSTRIHRAKQNEYVKLIGKAVGGNNLLIAPLSKRPCLYYYVYVEKKGDKSWRKYLSAEEKQDFFLDVDGERAIIKPAMTHFDFRLRYLVFDHEDSSGTFNDAKAHLESFLKQHDKSSTGFLGWNKTLRFKEGVIEPGETIAVKGIAEWKAIEEEIDGINYSKILTLKGIAEKKLIITDHPKGIASDDTSL
jgi:hypothetical protein